MYNFQPLHILLILLLIVIILIALWMQQKTKKMTDMAKKARKGFDDRTFKNQLAKMDADQVNKLLASVKRKKHDRSHTASIWLLLTGILAASIPASAQATQDTKPLLSETGILITIFLLIIPVLFALIFMAIKIKKVAARHNADINERKARKLAEYLDSLPAVEIEQEAAKRNAAISYRLSHKELSGELAPEDSKGLISIQEEKGLPFVAIKRKAALRTAVAPELSRLVIWYLITATFWLIFGTTVGEYLGIKFVAPDADSLSWLSFGRLRPVHTNTVFWGWASLGMLGLGYYSVPRVGNKPLFSYKLGWYALYLINATVLLGNIALMAGINNGGGEYREYIWPIMLLFGIALALTLYNFLKTIARRETKEIYISNWYIVAAIMFGITIAIVAYVPAWQNGLGETIIQGYYMHQGVGMWFMMFTLGLVYYYLPQQLNKPIYSYSLGILAFWTQILFYTLIGTHHFVFSSIPWWLQTVAIFGSVGMVIPVAAGTTNFLMTLKSGWYQLADSYTLPFFLVGTIFYFTGSMQGTAEAFRSTNLLWHFTDFTVAHSHLTMYGIISFFLWAAIYTLLPRLTRNEAPQITVGAHFWLALIGLLFYTVPLMYGSTIRGKMWMEGLPFIDSVVLMAPHWLWRAIGGTLMWISHFFFAYNLYKMMPSTQIVDVNEKAIEILQTENNSSNSKTMG
ncbi:cbb3-type cytochrome c oxidase subunit I [Haoranjiania flava]|uniref:Cbb3-type cytochrome c oxidase subunit I n=1 Tax=Haoranjiania flava TaxID=1856322 RepID=A0AAE3LKL9_9BACT|nr:cbb3-type cytochrome c oxidase subunit I [Haoranjiania flava]MCU7695067.1 cbb3-type cytochrome c oxidase subunit I [Haoranjiania flava]